MHSDYILYYYLREDMSSPYYVGYGRPRRINARHTRRNGAEILPPPHRRWVVRSSLTREQAIELEILHIKMWGREIDGGVLINLNTGGDGKPGGQKTKGFGGRTHTEDAKRRISEKVSGKNNPRYGAIISEELRNKIRNNKTNLYGPDHPNSKTWKLTDASGEVHIIVGGLKRFCKEVGISFATMSAAIIYDRKGPRKNGWSIEEVNCKEM